MYNKYGYHQTNRKPNFVLIGEPYPSDDRFSESDGIGMRIFKIVFGTFAFLLFCALVFGLYKLPSAWSLSIIPVGAIAIGSVALYLWTIAELYSGLKEFFKKK